MIDHIATASVLSIILLGMSVTCIGSRERGPWFVYRVSTDGSGEWEFYVSRANGLILWSKSGIVADKFTEFQRAEFISDLYDCDVVQVSEVERWPGEFSAN